MNENLDNYYLRNEEPNKSCLIALQGIIHKQDKHITGALKWGLPCFLYKNKMFCFLHVDKNTKEPYVLFVEGEKLNHPLLEKGKRARMKIFRVNPNKDLPIDILQMLINDALDLYRNGTIKTK